MISAPGKPQRHPLHWLFGSINIVMASCMFAALVELIMRGHGKMYFTESPPWIVYVCSLSLDLECVPA